MSKALRLMAVIAMSFIHFETAAGDKLYLPNEDAAKFGGTEHPDGYARDAAGEKMPVGVKVYGPGSSQYRAAQAAATTLGLQKGRNKMTGEMVFNQSTETLSRTVVEYVNFDYNDKRLHGNEDLPARIKLNESLLTDLEYVAIREQIEAKQGDLSNFTPASATA